MSLMNGTVMSALSMQEVIDNASQLVDRHLNVDRRYADLSDLLKVVNHKSPTVSGLQDFDYPIFGDSYLGLVTLPELSSIKRVPLPPELTEQQSHVQCQTSMGVFTDISRAWLSIDSHIFVWNYEDGGDLAYFDGLNEIILCAALVKPKSKIFQSHIEYLLCLTTPIEIVLLGVSFSHEQKEFGEMHLLPDPLFNLATDNVHIHEIVGTENGRIFMAAKDGYLYELLYQAQDGWFSRKCSKTNHSVGSLSFLLPSFLNFSFTEGDPLVQIVVDDSRHLLYARSQHGTIHLYDLAQDGCGTSRVTMVTQQASSHMASAIARTVDKSNFEPIVHIAVIPRHESINIHLVAITKSGVRLYFTTTSFNQPNERPGMLSLIHIRLPPGFSASGSIQRPANVHTSHYRNGFVLMSSSQSEENDLMWILSPDAFPFQNALMETQMTLPIDGKTWAVSEVPTHQVQKKTILSKCDPPLVVTQHLEPERRLVLLSGQGSYLMNKLRPVDQLRHLLIDNGGPDSSHVQGFFKLHKEDQACATCLILACSKLAIDKQVSEWALQAFFRLGGEAQCVISGQILNNFGSSPLPSPAVQTPGLGTSFVGGPQTTPFTSFQTPAPGIQPKQMSTPNPSFNLQQSVESSQSQIQGQQPPNQTLIQTLGQTTSSNTYHNQQGQEFMFSGKHEGVCLYLSRILRPLWDKTVVTDVTVPTEQGRQNFLASNFAIQDLSLFLRQLYDLKDFLVQNSKFTIESYRSSHIHSHRTLGHHSVQDGHIDETTRLKLLAEAQSEETKSMQQIEILIGHICETLGLVRILYDHQFHIIAAALTPDQQVYLKSVTFKTLIVNGRDICSALIKALVSRYLGDNASTDAISSKLREVCPSLYSRDDALCSKANEMLQSAKLIQNKSEKKRTLHDTLMLYKKIPEQLNLPAVCSQFSSVGYYEGIVDLCLTSAFKRDLQHLALHYYKKGEPSEDAEGMQAFLTRADCYKCILETLNYLLNYASSQPMTTGIPSTSSPTSTPGSTAILTTSEAEIQSEKVFKLCLQSEDELFHMSLYGWLIRENLTEKLLEISSPHLESYLKRASVTPAEDVNVLDLLWKYYQRNKNYGAAAKILSKLAERHGTNIDLRCRLEYLSRAIMCAKSSTLRTSTATEGEFLHELEEKMEVARIQLQILDALIKLPQVDQQAVSKLNADLFDITKLYGDFAEPYGLSECKLAIVHCAAHFDANLIQSLWQEIIDQEVERSNITAGQSKVAVLSNALRDTGKLYIQSERYFPIAFIVKHLEKRSCELNMDHRWVFRMLQETGVTLAKLGEIYDRLYKAKDPCWQSMRKPYHLLFVIYSLIESYTSNPTSSNIPAYDRHHFNTTTLDCVAGYLVDLQSKSSTDPTIQTLTMQFKSVQAKLERLP